MRTLRYPLYLPGALGDGSSIPATVGTWPRQDVPQVASQLVLVCGGAPAFGVPSQFKLTLDAGAGPVEQAGVYSLPVGLLIGENNVASLNIPANNFLGIICTQAAGASEITAWITLADVSTLAPSDPWWALTLGDLQAHMTVQELAEFTTSILQNGQPDTITTLIAQATNFVRGFVSSGGNVMGLEGTVPCELAACTLDFVKLWLFERTAALRKFSEDARLAAQRQREFLSETVGDPNGNFNVSTPWTLAVNQMQTKASVEVVSQKMRPRMTRCGLDGFQ